MTVHQLKESLKGIAPNSDIVFFPEGAAEDDEGNPLLSGLGVFNMESHEFVYLGDITIIDHD